MFITFMAPFVTPTLACRHHALAIGARVGVRLPATAAVLLCGSDCERILVRTLRREVRVWVDVDALCL